jgi:hypothetical protein
MRAVRCAFWVGINLALRGETSRASGWLGRAQRMVEREEGDCVERGYLLVPVVLRHEAIGDLETAYAAAASAAEIAERFGDADLLALAVHEQGLILVNQGRVEEGLGLVDEAMVAVTTGELSPERVQSLRSRRHSHRARGKPPRRRRRQDARRGG